MHTVWQDAKGETKKQVAPLSLVVSSFAPVEDVRRTLTPDLKPDAEGESSFLVYVDLGNGEMPLGATALAQVYGQLGDTHADADATTLKRFFNAMQKIVKDGLAMAYHDRSDGGLAVTLAEMAFTGGRGLIAKLPDGDALQVLFNEQPGAVLQVSEKNVKAVMDLFKKARVNAVIAGAVTRSSRAFDVYVGERQVLKTDITYLRRCWSETTYRMQALRDNPVTAKEEYDNGLDERDPGLNYKVTFDPDCGGETHHSSDRFAAASPVDVPPPEQGPFLGAGASRPRFVFVIAGAAVFVVAAIGFYFFFHRPASPSTVDDLGEVFGSHGIYKATRP